MVLLGSTGSIGVSTLDVVAAHPARFRVEALVASRNVDRLEEQARRFRPDVAVVADPSFAPDAARRLAGVCRVEAGRDAVLAVSRSSTADLVVNGLVGAAGLEPTWAAVDAGIDVALANKEALVAGGAFVTARAAESGALVLPVDSEHNALHQCLKGESASEVRRLWLTASGGPFRDREASTMASITPEEALRHPTWVMGPKITIDSATLMNKGLEIIEARWLFGVPSERIAVVIHPKSVVHSMVEFADGSFKAQLGMTDMRHPIQYAMSWPERWPSALPPFDPIAAGPLEFRAPDLAKFPCLALAREALERGGAAPAVLNAANEVAVEAFLSLRAGFSDIPRVVRAALERHGDDPAATLGDVLEADRRARATASAWLSSGVKR
ncbi:MAG TPA: 1-deoxy-D-xylulose-5-phosphate reductoisomerase [Candidatus Polarisedimenticolaceae bacterium]